MPAVLEVTPCLALIRDIQKARLEAATLACQPVTVGEHRNWGNIVPQKSRLAYVALLNPLALSTDINIAAEAIANYVRSAKPTRVRAIGSCVETGAVEALHLSLAINRDTYAPAETPIEKSAFPWTLLTVFGSRRRWDEVLEDMSELDFLIENLDRLLD